MENKKIYSLIPKIMADVGAIGKGGYNDYDKYNFRSIDDVYNNLQPALAKNGVFFVPEILESTETSSVSKNGTPQLRVKQKIKYTFFADDGSNFSTIVEGEAIDRSDKATNKAMTAALKYMLIQVFCIAVKDIDDADSESNEIGTRQQQQNVNTKKAIEGHKTEQKTQVKKTDSKIDFEKYTINFGKKMKGKKLSDFTVEDHRGMLTWLADQAATNNKPLNGPAKEYEDMATAYIVHLAKHAPPQVDQNEPMPE